MGVLFIVNINSSEKYPVLDRWTELYSLPNWFVDHLYHFYSYSRENTK